MAPDNTIVFIVSAVVTVPPFIALLLAAANPSLSKKVLAIWLVTPLAFLPLMAWEFALETGTAPVLLRLVSALGIGVGAIVFLRLWQGHKWPLWIALTFGIVYTGAMIWVGPSAVLRIIAGIAGAVASIQLLRSATETMPVLSEVDLTRGRADVLG